MEPQEKVWRGESGQSYLFRDIHSQGKLDSLAPFEEVAGFSAQAETYHGTLFRFPLREAPSDLSENCYTVQKLHDLLVALREEAKFLLLFLRSVQEIEVCEISEYGQQNLSFQVTIREKDDICHKREHFMKELRTASAPAEESQYHITRSIDLVTNFHVQVTDYSKNTTTVSHWLVANQVGSQTRTVLDTATKQCVFPWVGVALELSDGSSSPGGRIFCFLPMPIEASSPLPVHVNGTFGLNDDRRTLKWPTVERRNDPTAEWNKLLVSELLPPCYAKLLMEAKKHLGTQQLYEAWPVVDAVKPTPWEGLLFPLFTQLFSQAVVWTERTEALQVVGEWITIGEGSFIPKGGKIASVVCNALSRGRIKLVDIPPRIWSALWHCRKAVSEVSPRFVRTQLKSNPKSYCDVGEIGKLEILRYCLSDKQYSELPGLILLPLADHTFITFQGFSRYSQNYCYLCTEECPRHLLPNLDNILVDLPNDPDLSRSLSGVADKQVTQLRKLTAAKVAELIPTSMPSEWRYMQIVSLPHHCFPSDWFQTFWEWVRSKSLKSFTGTMILPISQSSQQYGVEFCVTRLNANSAVVYIPQFTSCSPSLAAALDKLRVRYVKVADFLYLEHRHLTSYLKQFNTSGVLDAIGLSTSISQLQKMSMTSEEANSLREFLSSGSIYTLNQRQLSTLQNLAIFTTAQNSGGNLHSVVTAPRSSLLRKAVVEPENTVVSASHLPPNLLMFSHEHYQVKLLRCLGGSVAFPSNLDFILDYLFPLIQRRVYPDHLLDDLMQEILDMFQILVSRAPYGKPQQFLSTLQNLPFLKVKSGTRKCPHELFDPSVQLLCELYKSEPVFPTLPLKYLQHLRIFGLRTTVKPQEIVDIICAINTPANTYPQSVDNTKMSRAKAILEYLSKCDSYTLSESVIVTTCTSYLRRSQSYPFPTALKNLATDRNWLPVCSSPPEDYPSCLEWKGRGFTSHFISLSSPVLIPTADNFHSMSLVVGSQVYLLDSTLPSSVSNIFAAGISVYHILAHFKEVILCKHKISTDTMTHIVDLIYKYLQASKRQYPQQLHRLKSFPEWIWIRRHNIFVNPDVVAMYQNSSFRHNLEPYIYILPDDLVRYSDLFSPFGMEHTVTKSQIVSVLSTIKDKGSGSNESESWQTVMSILNWLTSDGTQEPCLSEKDTLYVPVESESSWLQLMEPRDVVYTDNDFLKEFITSTDDGEEYTFVHHRIHPKMAHNLGVTPLSEHLDISEDTFEDAGQHEPLTVRLKNILKDYKDGLTIVKELLQNADDAEATEVNICYDARQHSVNPKSLFFPGMQECHGPALVVHNNATFSQDDFTNITKLAAATKASKPLKIGKFGVGFCSVYHITDVPSFVSQDTLCIFDPTLSYLKKEIKNPARPGKKVKFASRFIASSNQLVPYTGLFGFNPKEAYSGTMFRFPFRTSASELSGTLYTEATVNELIHNIKECSSKLFLFLQHIKRVTVSRINQGDITPTVLLKISKEAEQSIPGALAEVKKLSCLDLKSSQFQEDCWLVATHTDSVNTKRATASIACLLEVTIPGVCYKVKEVEGEIFCFLPLAQKTGLPVHVSSNFAVINNRRGIWTADEVSKSDSEVQWNMSLMQKVIPKAYHSLLVSVQQMHSQGMLNEYTFYSLWPLERDLTQHNPWVFAVDQLYDEEVSSSRLFYSTSTNQWLSLQESKFLEPGILHQSSTDSDVLSCVLAIVTHLRLPLVDLPSKYHTHISLSSSTVTEKDFIQLFFNNITHFTNIQQSRNEVLQCMLEVYAIGLDHNPTERTNYIEDCLTEHPCVPCTPDGSQLKMCDQVIEPQAEFSNLFDSSEGMFPIQQFSEHHLVVTAMLELGMISESIPWSMVIERAETIAHLYPTNRAKALKRVKLILQCIECNAKGKQAKQEARALSAVQFLPVMKKPVGFPLPWFGEGHQLLSGEQLMIKGTTTYRYSFKTANNNINIAGSQVAIVNETSFEEGGCGYINQKTREILQVRNSPSCQEVVNHLKLLISVFNSQQPNSELVDWTDRICIQAYEFLDGQIQQETPTGQAPQLPPGLQELRGLQCVWTGTKFIAIQDVAEEWKLNGPYLYPVPSSLACRLSLAASLGIKDKFTPEDIVRVLFQMKEDFNDNPVSDACQKLLRELVSQLYNIKPSECIQPIWLPDTSFVMHRSSDLAFNDAPWCKPEEHYKFVNSIIPRELALELKVKPVRSKKLEKYVSQAKLHFRGAPFGQHEELTQRIQNILREYPFDITVLKELLQNADDAKATKMYVILDKRTHGQESVLSEDWQQLQGPALLVWNDSTFSEKDLEGIQQLGLGSKRSDAETIGQYGIGFNVVYHLTDCPSFITGGETLCIMDPHCRFVPEASTEMPGRRFDDLRSGFWEDFPDLKSAYLQDGLKDCPPELQGGSLFRFPLRHTYKLMRSSKIVDHSTSYTHEALTANKMHRNLSIWAPKMKQALLFLNNVTELRFFVIEDNKQVALSSPGVSYASMPSLFSEHCFQVCIDELAQQNRARLHEKITAFKKKKGSEPCVVRYPLTITETLPDTLQKREKQKTEKWLIQQGIGDLEDKQQTWNYISQVKPKHGIAAPLSSSPEHIRAFFGNVFCFLPLPMSCNLPVHVNAHFILNASRRNLWQSTVPGEVDDKSRWNENLLKAISSSYADFLVHARSYYIKSEPFEDLKTLKTSAQCYYSVFPNWSKGPMQDQPVPEGPWFKLAQTVYRKLASHNANVLATIESTQSACSTSAPVQVPSGPDAQYTVMWHPLKNQESSSSQVYFWAMRLDCDDTPVKPILERIGMKITCAPLRIKNHFRTVECDIPETSPSSVYNYYTQFSGQVSPNGRFPCAVAATTFHSIADFKVFTQYLLQPSKTEPGNREFPKPPFGHPLLLTADGQLRNFDKSNKMISSQYSQLFPESFEKFLHPELLVLKYSTNYFLSPEDDPGSYTTIEEILLEALPHSLQTTHVQNAEEEHITKSMLTELWVCFSCDETFYSYLEDILKCWALLPSTTNQLFSSTNLLIPILPPSSDLTHFTLPTVPNFSAIYQVLHHLGMPFLATDIVGHQNVVQDCCPELSDYKHVLTNLYHLHRQNDLSSTITRDDITTLITYLQNINFLVCQDECGSIKALPLFLTIEGNLTSVNGKTVYIWPRNACISGYSKWMHGKNVVFLDECGAWVKLGPSNLKILGIEEIPEEKLYIQYIFPSFAKLSETERYQHLEHIRDSLFDSNKFILDAKSKSITIEQKYLARQFVDALKALPCIGREGEQLMHVSEFCTHQKEIFMTFSKHFHFLPECFISNEKECPKWIKFFRAIGLRETVSKQEFQLFCRETGDGQNDNLRKASLVLVNYLFSQEATDNVWYDDSTFLSGVSKIPFVCTEGLHKLSWIQPVHPAPNTIQRGNEVVHMTKLKGAALSEHANIVWAVKCVVYLPCKYWQTDLLEKLQVLTKPKAADVVNNIFAIARSHLADFGLFDNYPNECRPPKDAQDLIQIMLRHFQFLATVQDLTSDDLSPLKDLSCIPVYATSQHSFASRDHAVLVKPSLVLSTGDIEEYFPFLHCIPNELFAVHPVLEKIGVKSSLELGHMRIALETAFKCSDQGQLKLEVNTKHVVQKVIKCLFTLLKEQKASRKRRVADVEAALNPLYLPSEKGTLVHTLSLLYCDSYNYRNCTLNLKDTGFSLLHLTTSDQCEVQGLEEEFCGYLPESIRPKGLSQCCKQVVPDSCTEVEGSSVATSLQTTLRFHNFPRAILAAVKHVTGDEQLCRCLEPIITQFLQSIRIVAVQNLQTDIILKTREPNPLIGSLKCEFYLQKEETSWCFYLDSKISQSGSDLMGSLACQSLAEHLTDIIKTENTDIPYVSFLELQKLFTNLLMAQQPQQVKFVLYNRGIKFEGEDIQFETDITPRLGKPIPESWHHRLDQDIDNLFHPQEWVGYEDREDHFIFVQVIHPVVEEDGANSQDVGLRIQMKYKIYVSEDDEEGIKVGALDLYKFLRGKKAGKHAGENKALVPYEGETDDDRPRREAREETDLKSIKRQLCNDLREIWKLPLSEKTKAIRRLYLKWHPDKNPDRPVLAEEVFKFLQRQIERLERGLLLEDPDGPATEGIPSQRPFGSFSSEWSSYFRKWDRTAYQHSRSRESENHYRARGGGGGGGSGPTHAHFPFDEDPGPQPDQLEGERWVKQAEVDFRTLMKLLTQASTSQEVSASVCFMAHEVAEKALKGGMYAKCGLGENSLKSHNLTPLAYALQAKEPSSTQGLAGYTIPLENYYLDTRFPNRYPGSTMIPADHYSPEEAQQAKENAENILDMMKTLVNE